MKWISENKFLSVFLAVVIVSAIALTVLLFQSHSSYAGISTQYDEKARELQRLEGLQPYPNSKNLKETEARRDQYRDSMNQLLTKMAALTFPLQKDITPNTFQDELRSTVSAISGKADAAKVEKPEGFYLGFEPYQNTLPPPAAAAPLQRQLKAIELVVSRLIESKITKIAAVTRVTELPEESGRPAPAAKPNEEKPDAKEPLIERSSVLISFTCQGGSLRQILNELVQAKQFFVVRTLKVKNEEETGPTRDASIYLDPAAATPSPEGEQSAAPAPDSAPAGSEESRIKLLVGDEKLEVELLIEILNFRIPATEKQAAAK